MVKDSTKGCKNKTSSFEKYIIKMAAVCSVLLMNANFKNEALLFGMS